MAGLDLAIFREPQMRGSSPRMTRVGWFVIMAGLTWPSPHASHRSQSEAGVRPSPEWRWWERLRRN